MSIIVEFFAAPDDRAAALVLDGGPGRRFDTVKYGNFIPDLAIEEWAAIFAGRNPGTVLADDEPPVISPGSVMVRRTWASNAKKSCAGSLAAWPVGGLEPE